MKKLLIVVMAVAPALFAAEPKETVHLVVTGGANAGSYDASTDHGGCSAGLTGPGSFGNQLSQPKEKDPKKFNSLQLIVPSESAAAKGTSEFFLSVGFGPLLNRSAEYKVETRAGQKKSGSGAVHITGGSAAPKVTFDVATAAGVKLSGTIDCKSVLRAPGK